MGRSTGWGLATGVVVVYTLTAVATSFAAGGAPSASLWTTAPSTGVPRQEVTYVQAGGKLYLSGGRSTLQQVYDPTTRTWGTVAPLPRAMDHIGAVELGGKIYYVGGLTGYPGTSFGDVYVFDPSTNTFAARASMLPGRARGAAAVAVHQGRIYVAGGYHDGVTVRWFDMYDPATDRWASLPDLPEPRDHTSSAVVGGRLYVIGGRTFGVGRRSENDAFDFATNTWITGLAPLPTLRAGTATALFGDEIVVVGGEGPGVTFSEAEAYDTVTNSWRALAPMPTARHGIQAAMWNGSAFIADGGLLPGGRSPTDIQQVLSLRPGGSARPDARIRLASQTWLLGNDVYNSSGVGQTRSTTVSAGGTASFVVSVQNDGTTVDDFSITGAGSVAGLSVRYFRGATGTTDVTAQVVGGTYRVRDLPVGSARSIRVVVTVSPGTSSGSSGAWPVTATSSRDGTAADTVRAQVSVA